MTFLPLFLAPQDSAAPGGPSAALGSVTALEAPCRRKRNYISLCLAGGVQSKLAEITAGAASHATVPSPTEIQLILEAFIHLIVSKITAGEKVYITNFVTFKRRLVKARTHSNPQIGGAPVTVATHYMVYVEAKPAFKEKLKAVPILAVPPSGSQVSAPLDAAGYLQRLKMEFGVAASIGTLSHLPY